LFLKLNEKVYSCVLKTGKDTVMVWVKVKGVECQRVLLELSLLSAPGIAF
jgi:hypothetical protein